MKKVVYSLLGIAALIGASAYLLFGGAIGRLVVPGPAHRLRETVGVAYQRSDPTRRFAVNIERLIPYMREADWSSDRWALWKIPVVVELRDGRKLTIDRLGGMYAIGGIPGIFQSTGLSRSELEKYGSELNEVLQERPNQTPEPTPLSVTDRAGARSAPASVVAHL